MPKNDASLRELLSAWRGGDEDALNEILTQHQEWLHGYVRRRLGARLRQRMESMDVVQEAALDVMRHGPRFVVSSEDDFRALLGRIVENNLRDRGRGMGAARRDVAREKALEPGMSVDLDAASLTSASMKLSKRENREWVRLAVELLDPDDRDVVVLRQFDEKPWDEIAERLDLGASAARMRYERALPRLALKIQRLRSGRLDGLSAGEATAS